MYLNKAFIIGNLTKDPELKALPSGMQVTSFSVATNRVWKDKNGARQESADFHNIVVFGRQAETANQYLKKGASVLVEGRIQTRSWDGPDGKKNYRTEIIADRVQFGQRSGAGAGSGSGFGGQDEGDQQGSGGWQQSSGKGKQVSSKEKEQIDTIEYPTDEINPEDIPF